MAQPRLRRPEMYIGVHAGVMASTVTFVPNVAKIDIMQSPLAFNGGLVFRYAGHKVCAIQTEINYMPRGWHETIALDNGNTIDYYRTLHYLEVPLLMHLYLGKERFRGFLNLGPQIGYCFRDTEYGTKNPNAKHQYVPIEHPFDWGAAAGLGVYYRAKKVGLFQLEARFNYSFGSIFDNAMTDYYNYANPINLSINFAYMWQIK